MRHGEPDYEKDCLTELGRKQAQCVAERLLEEGIEEIYSSPLGRAVETAEAFSKRSGIGPIHTLDFMREIRFGYGEALYESGNPWEEADQMASEGKELLDPNWQKLPFFAENAATKDVEDIMEETDTWMQTLGYVRDGLYYRCEREEEKEHTIALFCHGGSACAMLSRILNLPFLYLCAVMHFRHTAITILQMDTHLHRTAMPVLELVNDARHLNNAMQKTE